MNNHSLRYAVSGACYVCMQIVRDDVLVSHICVCDCARHPQICRVQRADLLRHVFWGAFPLSAVLMDT